MADLQVDFYSKAYEINTVITIRGGPNNTREREQPVMDEINGNESETFTLEEFRKIILDFRKCEKDFILARVTTPDPYRQDVLYNYYYIASEVNKVLFKYESNRRLLHRMKVRNPLNNMYIIGQVYYYHITKEEVDRALVDCFFRNKRLRSKEGRRAFSAVFRSVQNPAPSDTFLATSKDTDFPRQQQCKEEDVKPAKDIIEDVRKGKLRVPEHDVTPLLVNYNAYFFATDDDFLLKNDTRDYFKMNSIDPSEDFLFELDRTENDLFAILETPSSSENDEALSWKRMLTFHLSLLLTLVGVVLLLGSFPVVLIIAFPLVVIVFLSFLCSLVYILCIRRNSFDSLAVRSVEEM
ncbi:hypothetical protein VCUG_00005, partial [Vavraia culicis subsp. floridensis]